MNRSFFIISALFLTSFYHATFFGMEQKNIRNTNLPLYTLVRHQDMGKQITDQLSREDLDDMRLVSKEFATKGPHWNFMPDSVEKKYNECIKQYGKIDQLHKIKILCVLTNEDDSNAVQWIINANKKNNSHIQINYSIPIDKSKAMDFNYDLYPYMIAINNKNHELARLLIETNTDLQEKNWKYYHKAIIPHDMQYCLPYSHERDFSFIPYIIAIWTDNPETLKKLYIQKKPTLIGLSCLLDLAVCNNASDCFTLLLDESDFIYETVKNNSFQIITTALDNNAKEIAQKMIIYKLYSINSNVSAYGTLFKLYCNNTPDALEKKKYIIAFLKELGAK